MPEPGVAQPAPTTASATSVVVTAAIRVTRPQPISGQTLREAPLAEERRGDLVVLRGHGAQLLDRLAQGDERDPSAAQRGHHSPAFIVRGVDGGYPQPGGKHAVERGRGAT